jgi:hypothetical protein
MKQNETASAEANTVQKQLAKLSLRQKLALKVKGCVFLRYEKRPGWTSSLPIYLVKCGRHGLFEDYKHGHSNYFMCPKCQEEMLNKLRQAV